jgi:hypothetical protein
VKALASGMSFLAAQPAINTPAIAANCHPSIRRSSFP